MTKLKMLSMLTVMIASLFIFPVRHLPFSTLLSQQAAVRLSICAAVLVQIILLCFPFRVAPVFLIIVTLMERLLQGSMERVISGTKSSGKIPGVS